jgi:hypothetical protein
MNTTEQKQMNTAKLEMKKLNLIQKNNIIANGIIHND